MAQSSASAGRAQRALATAMSGNVLIRTSFADDATERGQQKDRLVGSWPAGRKMETAPQAGPFPESERSRSVAAAFTPDKKFAAAPFADGHIATTLCSVAISPIAVPT